MSDSRTARRNTGSGALFGAARVLVLVGVAIGVGIAACGPATPPSASPGRSPSAATADGSAGPKATPWPGNAVLGIKALGAADGSIVSAIGDLGKGIQTEDLALMRSAADGLAGIDVLLPNMDKINIYPPMQSFAARYGDAVKAISTAAKALRAAIDNHDAAAIPTTTEQLLTALQGYSSVQPELASWVEQSIDQQRLLLK